MPKASWPWWRYCWNPGSANPLIDKVWTYMPLDAGDRVRMPRDLLNLNELLPADQRYYQFMGSLTTPPCSEGVLWMGERGGRGGRVEGGGEEAATPTPLPPP